MDRWLDKVCVVTGASAGIGADIAKRLTIFGCQVVGLARRVELVEELAAGLKEEKGKLIAKKCDITNEEEVEACFQWIKDNIGPIHILINNAGVVINNTFCEGDPKIWKQVLDTNVYGLAVCSHFAIKQMKECNINGHIVNINSLAGHAVLKFTPQTHNIYAPTKHAVTAIEKVLSLELAELGLKIKVSNVSPGLVAGTDIFRAGNFEYPTPEVIREMPHIKVEDVTEAVLYVLGTPPHVQVQDVILKGVNEVY